MSRQASRHIRRLEDLIQGIKRELDAVPRHRPEDPLFKAEKDNPNCQCGVCRAKNVLEFVPKRGAECGVET